jgi:hypothetical protein
VVAVIAIAAAATATATAILIVTRNSEVVGSTSDEATGVLTWLLRTCPTAHSDCSKLGDEKYVTGKYPSWRIITTGHVDQRATRLYSHVRRNDPGNRSGCAFPFSLQRARAMIHVYVCCAFTIPWNMAPRWRNTHVFLVAMLIGVTRGFWHPFSLMYKITWSPKPDHSVR